jgi:hypothetical protein
MCSLVGYSRSWVPLVAEKYALLSSDVQPTSDHSLTRCTSRGHNSYIEIPVFHRFCEFAIVACSQQGPLKQCKSVVASCSYGGRAMSYKGLKPEL